ncbi:MAG: DUF4405 domain-containing protein [Anaerolineales bacterium]|nr:DUF4405 domain-containing protein [Anaerolineales bacterium]
MKIKLNFWIDVAILCIFLVAMEPGASGVFIHEWLTTSAVAILIVHFVLHWEWFMTLTARFFVKLWHSSRLNYLLSIALFLGFATLMVSGFAISEKVLPTLGVELAGRGAWKRIHDLSANLTLLIIALHIGLRWEWVWAAFKKIFVAPFVKERKADSPVLIEEDGL